MEAYVGRKDGEMLFPGSGLWEPRRVFSGRPASSGPGWLEDELLLQWPLECTLFLPHAVVCLAPQCLYLPGI